MSAIRRFFAKLRPGRTDRAQRQTVREAVEKDHEKLWLKRPPATPRR